MTQEEKQLLLKDLCGRVPYGVKYNFGGYDGCVYTMDRISLIAVDDAFPIEDAKPYLRPMSSMTEDEMKELRQEHAKDMKMFADCLTKSAEGDNSERGKVISHHAADWCNKNHFDYRGLIPMGLALEAPDGLYET